MGRNHTGAWGPDDAPGYGFGLGFSVLHDPRAAQSPESGGTWRWGGAYGHSWFVDRTRALSVVAFTNTLYEGMSGRFVADLRDAAERARLPLSGLLALAAAGFITVLTEAMPAGLLPQIGESLAVAPALVGQLVTVYAIGSLVAAIPLVAFTRGWRRRPLLMLAIGGFAIVNTVTALSTHYPLTLVARFFAGVFAGLLWALLAGHAARMVPPSMQGRAIAV
eukprot:gene543-762_t